MTVTRTSRLGDFASGRISWSPSSPCEHPVHRGAVDLEDDLPGPSFATPSFAGPLLMDLHHIKAEPPRPGRVAVGKLAHMFARLTVEGIVNEEGVGTLQS